MRLSGVVLVLLGAVSVLVSFRFLDWYDVPTRHTADSTDHVTFSSLRSSADQLRDAGSARAYFDWLAWVLLIALIVAGVAANLPSGAADACRVAGFLIGLVGFAGTYLAMSQLHNAQVAAGAERHNLFYNATWGPLMAPLGFLVGAVGAVLGPRSVSR